MPEISEAGAETLIRPATLRDGRLAHTLAAGVDPAEATDLAGPGLHGAAAAVLRLSSVMTEPGAALSGPRHIVTAAVVAADLPASAAELRRTKRRRAAPGGADRIARAALTGKGKERSRTDRRERRGAAACSVGDGFRSAAAIEVTDLAARTCRHPGAGLLRERQRHAGAIGRLRDRIGFAAWSKANPADLLRTAGRAVAVRRETLTGRTTLAKAPLLPAYGCRASGPDAEARRTGAGIVGLHLHVTGASAKAADHPRLAGTDHRHETRAGLRGHAVAVHQRRAARAHALSGKRIAGAAGAPSAEQQDGFTSAARFQPCRADRRRPRPA